MTITTAMIKQLREVTGAGPLACKEALQAKGGDVEKATEYLRVEGLTKAAKKADRETPDGLVIVKSSDGATCAVELNCETDFVARTKDFKTLAHRLADQVLADANLTSAEILLAADFIDTPGKTTADVIQEFVGQLGENIVVPRVARYTSEGVGMIEGYVHAGAIEGYGPMEGRIGVLVELDASDAAADSETLSSLAHDLALQIAAIDASYLSPDDIPAEVMQDQYENMLTPAEKNKPEPIKAKIVAGRLNKFYQEVCLLKQAFIRDESLSIEELLQQKSKELGAPVTINRFTRFEVGA
jgi:elongation factor Ts